LIGIGTTNERKAREPQEFDQKAGEVEKVRVVCTSFNLNVF